MSDSYPEYLNPFAEDLKPKPKVTLRHSFKEFKKSLRQSFRIKRKSDEDVTYRQKTDTIRRIPVSYPSPQRPQTEALPRSRFHERVSNHERRTDDPTPNPFQEEEENRTVRRKGKKRAPLPPKSISSQHINEETLGIPAGGSHWSLTSVETDYSGSADNASRDENESEVKRTSMVDKFIVFNKNMNELKDDTNNNVVTKEDIVQKTESNNNIPDLVVSCPSENDKIKPQSNSNEDEEPSSSSEEELSTLKDDTDLIVKDITNNMIIDDNSNREKEETHNNREQEETHSNKEKEETQISEQNSENEDYLYHEKKSLYIAGSRDELTESDTYLGRVSLYITGSCDDLDASNEGCNENITDENSNDDAAPIPKQRKNKLTKNALLGM